MKSAYPIIEVTWIDAQTEAQGWEFPDDTEVKVPVVMTVGFLIKESLAGMLVASTVCEEKSTNARITIPRGMLVSVRYLRGKPRAAAANKKQPKEATLGSL